jgi:hypothetical protein
MTTGKPNLYATLTKAESDPRYLIIQSVDGSRATELSQMSNGVETLIGTGSEYEMRTKADELIKSWTKDEGFHWLSDREFAWEPLSKAVALARRMGFIALYDASFKQMNRLPLNPLGVVALDGWPGMTPKNGGGYEYALGLLTLHARPTLSPNLLPTVAPTGGNEFAEFLLKHIELRNSVGPAAEFILTER